MNNQTPKRIAYTIGEPAGIGPDLIIKLAQTERSNELVVFGCPENLAYRAKQLDLPLEMHEVDFTAPPKALNKTQLSIFPICLPKPQVCGTPHLANQEKVLLSLKEAFFACKEKLCHAMVTGPVQKSALHTKENPFYGHTEFFAHLGNAKEVMMAFYHPKIMLGLATTHIPLSEVPKRITKKHIMRCIRLMHQHLNVILQIKNPRIGVLGLNPHAGESGQLGLEEIQVISPIINRLKEQGLLVSGPISGDSAFIHHHLEQYDGLLAMYHDQGLGPLKTLDFGKAVNVTLGLPIIRTSVDHGTALDIAGTGRANPESLQSAIDLATKLNSSHYQKS